MIEFSRTVNSDHTVPDGLLRLAGWCAYMSGAAAIIGLVFLAIFFGGGPEYFGPLNDMAVIIHYILLLPIVFTLYLMLRPYGQRLNLIATIIGLAGMLGVIVLQTLLVIGVLPFEQQIGMVVVAFLVALVWFVITGHLGRSTGIVPKSVVLNVLAGLVFGYPVWTFMLGRRLLEADSSGSH
jgi:hypothetical protein